ncbi:acyl carrier protein [Siccirubricoccus deserti]|uniref:Acyl carrier protein n=1 Tax=Siccirubricoccus deserti TaxID=2013562 RepID=A0A9X0R2T2_9PROT|nr:acyl carrier protein [Siccirubricoccus deserti]MBC4018689.1 acyl carrier protein [Siccirubricoccus deserti]GGC67751.1 acyl carrier protein [Siccirubricoccus deserti]
MTEAEIYAVLTQVFRDVFDDDEIVLDSGTTAEDIAGWDSQAHVNLVVAAEMKFGVRFRTAELESLHNVGEFVQLIAGKHKGG